MCVMASWVSCVMSHMGHGSQKMTHFHLCAAHFLAACNIYCSCDWFVQSCLLHVAGCELKLASFVVVVKLVLLCCCIVCVKCVVTVSGHASVENVYRTKTLNCVTVSLIVPTAPMNHTLTLDVQVTFYTKGAITSKIKHAIKLKTSPARLAQLLHNCCSPH